MTKQSQNARFLPSHPLWMRLAAIFSFLLVLVASSAQATHVHGDWLPHSNSQVTVQTDAVLWPADETSCPLCMAMHSAMPTGMHTGIAGLCAVSCRIPSLPERVAWRMLYFSLFSRPPPTSCSA